MNRDLLWKIEELIEKNEITQTALFRFSVEERIQILKSNFELNETLYKYKNLCQQNNLKFFTITELDNLFAKSKDNILTGYEYDKFVPYITKVKTAVYLLKSLDKKSVIFPYYVNVAKNLYKCLPDERIYLMLYMRIVVNTSEQNISSIVKLITSLKIDRLIIDFLNRPPVELTNKDRNKLIMSISDYEIQEKYLISVPKLSRLELINQLPNEEMKIKHLKALNFYNEDNNIKSKQK